MMFTSSYGNFVCVLLSVFELMKCQLVVNVKNNGGDVYRENIEANTTQDTIALEFRKADGTIVTQFIDGKNELQIFRVVILPEEELGLTEVQTMCFVVRFVKNEFISSDAMSKLRQKNPSTVRHPEEARAAETFAMDVSLNVAASHVLSPHIKEICRDATTMTYARDSDLHTFSQILNRDYSILQSVAERASAVNISSCSDVWYEPTSSSSPCLCHYDVCIGWYPCGLKYCRGKDSAGRIVSYRCGIKTCSRCRLFEFPVLSKSLCIWDEPEFHLPELDVVETGNGYSNEVEDPVAVPVPNDSASKQEVVPSQPTPPAGVDDQRIVKMSPKPEVADLTSTLPPPHVAAVGNIRHSTKTSASRTSPRGGGLLDDDEDGE